MLLTPFRRKMTGANSFLAVVSTVLLIVVSRVSSASILPSLDEDEESFAGESVTRVGTCYRDCTLVEINFPLMTPPLISVCHDEATDFTWWSMHHIYGAELEDAESGGNRPAFKKGDFYSDMSVNDCYTQATQTETIGMLVGSRELALEYIQTSKNLFLARGHLTPNGDPIKMVEKHATFYFINASPQWQTINGGNWVKLEEKLREIAEHSRSTLTVWTGSYGIMKLKDITGTPVEIWLGRNSSDGSTTKRLPVNHLTWKVIHDPATRTGVAVIQINNPWLEAVSDEDILCDDVCDQIDWVTWNRTDIVSGYTYCCSVQSFREKVDYAPDLGNLPLLKNL